jgi:hypothetical protein
VEKNTKQLLVAGKLTKTICGDFMSMLNINHVIYYGRSRKDLKQLVVEITDVNFNDGGGITGRIKLSGIDNFYPVDKKQTQEDLFEYIVLALSSLRRMLVIYQKQNPEIKFFIEFDGKFYERSIESIFGVEDCIPE